MSGASGSLGVTRYQWPRIIAAKTPPVASGQDRQLQEQPGDAEPAVAPRQRPEDERGQPGGQGRQLRPRGRPPGRIRRTTSAATSSTQNRPRADRRGASQTGSMTTGELPSVGRQGPVAEPGQEAEARGRTRS